MTEVETLEDWSDEQKAALGVVATAKYSTLSESIRGAVAEATMCSMFCGGKNCKYESAAKWSKEQQAIDGLYSNWITNKILAMARPNTEQIKNHEIIKQFLDAGIRTVINLQLVGEHASCGPALEPGGFTYVQQDFMDNDVFFYNFGWHDYNVGSLIGIVDAARVMQFALSQGKVAVHCHAGLGRTGVLIACYLIFANRLEPDTAINYVRRQRPGSVQSRCQIKCIRDFADFLQPTRIVFSSVKLKIADFTLGQFLHRQKLSIHGNESRYLRYLPKIIYVCCERLLELAGRRCEDDAHKARLFISASKLLSQNSSLAKDNLFHCADPLGTMITNSTSSSGSEIQRDRSNFTAARTFALDIRSSVSLESLLPIRRKTSSLIGERTSVAGFNRSASLAEHLASQHPNHSLTNGSIHSNPEVTATRLPTIPSSSRPSRQSSVVASGVSSVVDVMGRVKLDYSPESLAKVDGYKERLNVMAVEWWQLRLEDDPCVLAALIYDWIDELKEPILSIQDLPLLLDGTNHPIASLNYLEKGPRQTIGYLFYFVACLEPMGEQHRNHVIQRLISTLTQQSMTSELDDVTVSMSLSSDDRRRVLSRSNNEGRMRSDVAKRLRLFFENYLRLIKVCPCLDERAVSRRLDLPQTSSRTPMRPQTAKSKQRKT